MKYQVGITIYNTFEVEADSKEIAEYIVREYCNDAILNDCDFNVTYADEVVYTDEINNQNRKATK
tara:strand:+ start:1369 stop:1563 length:195 start_codon:yes stop_codon:yes gene_type:complete